VANDVDFGKTARDYGRHRAGFPDAFFARLSSFGLGRAGQRILDLGTGTGTIARGLARRGSTVTGLDRSIAMMAEAQRLDAEAGVHIDYIAAPAEATGLADASFDAVTAGQCWHWFDRAAAAREARRLLVGDGLLVIAHFDWVARSGNLVERTDRLIRAHNPGWPYAPTWPYAQVSDGTGLYPRWLDDVAEAGFIGIETFSFDVLVPYSHEGWRGRLRANAGIGAALTRAAIGRFDAELAQILAADFPAEPLEVPHRVWAVVCRSPANR